ncbi:MAG: putative glycoside hydrolase, partial [bacterium]
FGPAPKEKENYAMDIFSVILGGNSSSKLFNLIREQLGLAYRVRTSMEKFNDCSVLIGYIGLNHESVEEVKPIIVNEIKKIANGEITEEELSRAKNFLNGKVKISSESSEAQVSFISDAYIHDISLDVTKSNVKSELNSNKNVPWKDRKGLSFIDAGSTAHGDYIAALAEESYNKFGFDELNFDYIRFPSDGNMQDIYFPFSEQVVEADPQFGKAIVVRDFFARLSARLKPQGIKMSADLFGMTTTNTDDLNIGQVLEYAAPYFDYLAPMVYPSHYPVGFNGWKDPNKVPYEIVKFSMDKAVARLQIASTSIQKLRPWLQDNDYPVPYTPEMVRAQIKATYDSGLTSWMLWDAANTYTRAALLNE